MASITDDTAEGSGELDMNTWLVQNKLSSLLKNQKFMGYIQEQEATIQDILDLTEDDLMNLTQECGLRVLEKNKFLNVVKKLQENKDNDEQPKQSKPIIVIRSEAEENAVNNVEKQQQTFEQYIDSLNESIKNTKSNAKRYESEIDQEFNKLEKITNKRKMDLKKQLKIIENRKLKIYNNNLDKIITMNNQLKDAQRQWHDLLLNTKVSKRDRKTKVISESQNILNKSNYVLKNGIVNSVNDMFNVKFNSLQNCKYIGNIGKIDENEVVPQLSVAKVAGNSADINIELKIDDDIMSYGLQYKQTNENSNGNNLFIDAEDDEKNNLCAYLEFKDSKYSITNLKQDTHYSIRVKAKISQNFWTNYSNVKSFKTVKHNPWSFDSTILTDPNEILIFKELLKPQIKSILNKEEFTLKLLYRNSTDGNSVQSFHSKCDGHSNTIVLVHSNYNHVFGGFTTTAWDSTGWRGDDNAFLFLVRSAFHHQPRIYKFISQGDLYAVCGSKDQGPYFGGGGALYISYGSKSATLLGRRYEGTGNQLSGGETYNDKKELCSVFDLVQYEVFDVK